MSAPKRIQRKRTKGWRMPEGAVYVGRPSKWGNPFAVDKTAVFSPFTDEWWTTFSERDARALAVEKFREALDNLSSSSRARALAPLVGRDLACWCPLDQPCHADVLLEIANGSAS